MALSPNPSTASGPPSLTGTAGRKRVLLFRLRPLPPLKGEVAERSEVGGVNYQIKGRWAKAEGVNVKKRKET